MANGKAELTLERLIQLEFSAGGRCPVCKCSARYDTKGRPNHATHVEFCDMAAAIAEAERVDKPEGANDANQT